MASTMENIKNIITSHVISPYIAEKDLKTTVLDIPNRLVIVKARTILIIAKIIINNISLTLDIQIPPPFHIFNRRITICYIYEL